MKLAHIVGLTGSLIVASTAHAAFIGLSVTSETSGGGAAPAGGPRTIYHVYANFNDPTDMLVSWFGNVPSPANIRNVTAGGLPGSGFTNISPAAATNLAPQTPGTARDWDSYMTIGLRYGFEGPGGFDATTPFGAYPNFINDGDNFWITDRGGVEVTPSDIQGCLAFRQQGNDTDHNILLMQLVVNAGEHVAGTINLSMILGWCLNGQPDIHTVEGAAFSSIPAPGALSLIGVAGLFSRRRRRVK